MKNIHNEESIAKTLLCFRDLTMNCQTVKCMAWVDQTMHISSFDEDVDPDFKPTPTGKCGALKR